MNTVVSWITRTIGRRYQRHHGRRREVRAWTRSEASCSACRGGWCAPVPHSPHGRSRGASGCRSCRSACIAAIGVLGMWDIAMDTLSQVIVAVILCVAIAVPVGIWSSQSDRAQRALRPFLDVMQTMPQFVYLVPVIALFEVGTRPRRDRRARVRAATRHPLDGPRDPEVPCRPGGGGGRVRCHEESGAAQGAAAAGAALDPPRREPDDHDGALGRDHRRADRRRRAGPRGAAGAQPRPRPRAWSPGSASCSSPS